MIISVYTGTVADRFKYEVSDSDTLKSVIEKCTQEHGTNFNRGRVELNSRPVSGDDLNKSFKDYGVEDVCFLCNVPKDNGG